MTQNQMTQEQQRIYYEGQMYYQQLQMMRGEMEKITLTMLDVENAKATISKLKETDALIPVGGNSFIETKITSEKVIVPIGGGYSMKMGKKEAEEELARRSESIRKVLEKLQKEYEMTAQRLREIEDKLRTSGAAVQR